MNTISNRELEPFLQKLCKQLQCPGEGIVFIMNTTPDEIHGLSAAERRENNQTFLSKVANIALRDCF